METHIMAITHHTFRTSLGETLAYSQTNTNGPVLMLDHGNMSSKGFFTPTMERLASSMHVIAVDMRGFGDSTYHHRFDSLKELGDDLLELVKHLDLHEVTLLGWSTGGGVDLIECPVHLKDQSVPVVYAHHMKDALKEKKLSHLIPHVGHAYLNDAFEGWIKDLERVIL